MPWAASVKLTDSDAKAIETYLKSLSSVSNKVPRPFGSREAPILFVMTIVPPAKQLGTEIEAQRRHSVQLSCY